MKIILHILIYAISLTISAQNKQEIVDGIIAANAFHNEQVGGAGVKSPVYELYEKLIATASTEELITLAKHKNAAVRMYAIKGLIVRNAANVPELFAKELKNGDSVETLIGCSLGDDYTHSIVYRLQRDDAPASVKNNVLTHLDSIIITTKYHVDWTLYDYAFSNTNLDKALLPAIEQLVFSKNNSFAFDYLEKNYSEKYKAKLLTYIFIIFPDEVFKENTKKIRGNEEVFLRHFITKLLNSKNPAYREIALRKQEANPWLKN